MVALRRTRQRHRLGNIEWFDAAYRVYLVALFGGGTVLWISSLDQRRAGARGHRGRSVDQHAPALIGMHHHRRARRRAAQRRARWPAGPRGARRHVRHALAGRPDPRPAAPGHATAALGGLARRRVGAIVGQLAGRRLPGTTLAWAGVGAAVRRRRRRRCGPAPRWSPTPLRLPLWITTIVGLAPLAWQGAAVVRHIPGPGNTAGSLAHVGLAPEPRSTLAIAVAVGARRRRHLHAAADVARRARPAQQPRRPAALRGDDAGPAHRHPAAPPAEPGAVPRPSVDPGAADGSRARRLAARLAQPAAHAGDALRAHDSLAALAGVCQAFVVRGTTPALLGHRRDAVHPRSGGDGAAVAGDRPTRSHRQPARSNAAS